MQQVAWSALEVAWGGGGALVYHPLTPGVSQQKHCSLQHWAFRDMVKRVSTLGWSFQEMVPRMELWCASTSSSGLCENSILSSCLLLPGQHQVVSVGLELICFHGCTTGHPVCGRGRDSLT